MPIYKLSSLLKNSLIAATLLGAFAGNAIAAFGPPATPTNLLVNGSFEAHVVTAADNVNGSSWVVRSSDSTPGWTQFADGVDLIHNNYEQGPALPVLVDAADGVNFLDLNQGGALGGVYQTVGASAGQLFHLDLDAAAWAANARGGKIGYQLYDPASSQVLASGSFTDPTGGTWTTRSLDAMAISSSIGVRIQGLEATQAGMGLDRVVLSVSAVPEPKTYALMVSGLGMVILVVRRRRRA